MRQNRTYWGTLLIGLGIGWLPAQLFADPTLQVPDPKKPLPSLIAGPPAGANCSELVQVFTHLADLMGAPHWNSTSLNLDNPLMQEIVRGNWAPEWMKQLAVLQQHFQPHLEFIQFADSALLTRITALQLQDLGIRSGAKARDFLAEFPTLPTERRHAFATGLVFRLLVETQNRFALLENQQRLGMQSEDFERSVALLSTLKPEGLSKLTLFIMCHFAFRAETFAQKILDAWPSFQNYESPLPREMRNWVELHGIFADPASGQRTYDEKALVSLVGALLPLEAAKALSFLALTEGPQIPVEEVHRLLRLKNLPESVRSTLEDVSRGMSPSRSLQAAEMELKALAWLETFQSMGTNDQILKTLQSGLDGCDRYLQSSNCAYISSSIEIFLRWMGCNTNDWAGYLLGNFLNQIVIVLSGNSNFGIPVTQFLNSFRSETEPIFAFARGLSPGNQGGLDLLARRRVLQKRIEILRAHLQAPQP